MVQRGPKLKLIQKEPQLKTVSIGVEFKAPYGATYSEIRLNQPLSQKGKNLTLLELWEKNFLKKFQVFSSMFFSKLSSLSL